MTLLSADARSEIAVHELDDRPPRDECAIDVEDVHVVGEAEVGRPAGDSADRRLDAFNGEGELRKTARGRGRERGGRGVTMHNREIVPAGRQAGRHGVQIILDAAGIAESVVCEQDAHGGDQKATNLRIA